MPKKESGFCSYFFCQTRWGGGAAPEPTTKFGGVEGIDRSEQIIQTYPMQNDYFVLPFLLQIVLTQLGHNYTSVK